MTVFTLVVKLQLILKAQNFNSIALFAEERGLGIALDDYIPTNNLHDVSPSKKKKEEISFFLHALPKRAEEFLRDLRLAFPGVSFQLLTIELDGDMLYVRSHEVQQLTN